MMEIHRDFYMDEEMGIETPGLQRMRELIVRVMRGWKLHDECGGCVWRGRVTQ